MELLKKMVLWLDLQLLVVVLKMGVQLCTSVHFPDMLRLQRLTLKDWVKKERWGQSSGTRGMKGYVRRTRERGSVIHRRKPVFLSCLTVIPPLPARLCFPAECLLGQTVLLRPLQSHEPHAVHRVRCPSTRQHVGPVDHHAEYDCGGHVLRHVCGSRHCSNPITGLLTKAIPRKGELVKLGMVVRGGLYFWLVGVFFLTIKLCNSLKLILTNWAIMDHNIWA